MFAIQTHNLVKQYKNFQALKDINFEIKEGDFFALLGVNGAGKSTIIGILTDLVKKTSGKVEIF
jgi:ABC-2 type transport system ATP-binding protein